MSRVSYHDRVLTHGGKRRTTKRRQALAGASIYCRRLRVEPLEDRRLLATITVDTLVDGSGVPGTSLREAITAAASNDTINFSVTGTINLISTGQLTINKNLTITGPGANLLTIQAYNPSPTVGNGSRVFNVDDGSGSSTKTVSISGLTLAGGDVTGDGGAIRTLENLTLTNSIVSGSAATHNGGGIFSSGHTLVVNNSTVSGSSARYGGGIYCVNGTFGVTGSTISGNSATYADGGGIYSHACPVTVTSCTISGNTSAGDGAGIFTDGTTLTVTSSTISGNMASGDGGGGIYTSDSTLTLTNSTISGNQSATNGGGIYAGNGAVTVAHSTITGNRADSDNNGSGLTGGFRSTGTGTKTLRHTIIAGNIRGASTRSDATGSITLQYSLIGDNTGATINNSGGNVIGTGAAPINPLLGPLANNGGPTMTHALLGGSPAIDGGNASAVAGSGGVPQFDQRGTPNGRVVDGDGVGGARIDIGAFEVQPNHAPTNPAAVTLAAINEDLPNASNTGTLVSAIVTASGSTDSDGNSLGIAVTAADNANGQWQYSTNGGGNWQNLAAVSTSSALLLAPAHFVRFVPNANFNSTVGTSPTISFKTWDQTSGTSGSTDDTTNGTAYSTVAAQATQPVTAVNDEQVLATNNVLTVDRGASAVITTSILQTTDIDDTASDLVYTVTTAPAHGAVRVSGSPVTQFTQQQINAGQVSYQSDGTATLADSFAFTVDDGEGTTSSGTFQITVRPFAGDYNGDGTVDTADYVVWRMTSGRTGLTPYSGADGSGNGSVGEEDYGVWRANFGNMLPSGAGSGGRVEGGVGSVEGTSATLVVTAALASDGTSVAKPVAESETTEFRIADFGLRIGESRASTVESRAPEWAGRIAASSRSDEALLAVLERPADDRVPEFCVSTHLSDVAAVDDAIESLDLAACATVTESL